MREVRMTPINGKQDPNSILSKAYANWETRINTPKGNPNIPRQQTINMTSWRTPNLQSQYQAYYNQCMATGQMPMSPMQYMQAMQQGTIPGVNQTMTFQEGMTAGMSLGNALANLGKALGIGNAKNAKANETQQNQPETQTLIKDYQTALQTKGEAKIENVDAFVDAEFAQMKAKGDTVSVEQYSTYLQSLGFDEIEANVIALTIDEKNTNTLSKSDIKAFYKTAMGDSNTVSGEKLEKALTAYADRADKDIAGKTDEITNKMKEKGYTPTTQMINGEITSVFKKGDEVITWDDPKLAEIIDG